MSALMRIVQKLSNAAQFRLDRYLVGPSNARLARRFKEQRQEVLTSIDAAIDRGVDWFANHQDLTMSAILVMDQARQQTGDGRLKFLEDRIQRYIDTYYDPGLRAVVRDYDTDAYKHLPDVTETRPYQVIELIMIDAANLDQRGDPETVMRYLKALADGGGYGSTHIIVGGLLMKRAGVALNGRVDAMIAAEVDAVARGNARTSYPGDLFAERIFVLEWLGRHDLIDPAWIVRLLGAQRPDGGWRGRNVPPIGQSNQHTTSLAIAALAQFAHAERAGIR